MLRTSDPDTGKPMTEEQLVDNLATFLLAGHETTAKALTWTLYVLARAPLWQQRIREEVERVAPNRDLTHADVADLSITQRVLKETMRLYPPVPTLTRLSHRTVELGGLQFGSGTLFVAPVYAVHRHRALWERPEKFDPDRFLPERESAHKRCQFLPFGAGPRVCIGGAFAMLEATVILATLLRHSEFAWDGSHEPEPVGRITLHPSGGMPLKVRKVTQSI